MAVENGDGERKAEGRCVLVGLRMDATGKALLRWALNQAASRGDRVMAVHIYSKSDLCRTNTLSLIKTLDDYLAEYESLCNTKEIVLVGRVTPGSSIQKVLVREAKLCAAMTVVVGVNKNYSFGGSTSLAKYCAKKLPPTTSIVAIQNGKPTFVREATEPPLGTVPRPTLRTVLHPSVGMEPKVIIPNPNRNARSMDFDVRTREHEVECKDHRRAFDDATATTITSSSTSGVAKNLSEQRLGWPLLRRPPPSAIDTPRDDESRKLSVVQWAMSLPKRSSLSPVPQDELTMELKQILQSNSSSCRWFRYEDLYGSTNHFSSENLIGNGGNSKVYKGCLPSGRQVAVKLSKLSAEASKDFLLEVDISTKLQHKRVVPLIGICLEGPNLISVYSYLSTGSLEDNLHGKRSKPPLSWDKRYKAAVGIAEALAYLHAGYSRPVIHRDVKSSNILLTDEFEPQLSDFGLAIWAPSNSTALTDNVVVGTFGYLAPEYFMYGKVSDKIDVYAFGVVLLELLTGRKPISDETPKGQESLVMWASPILNSGDISDLLDPNLDGKHDGIQVRRMAFASTLCLTRSARLRPRIWQILSLLEGENFTTFSDEPNNSTEMDALDDETYPTSSIKSHLGLALLDVDDVESISSTEHSNLGSLEDYLRERWSRSSSFD